MKSIEPIRQILAEQVKGYNMLLNLLQRERACLLDFNAAGVEELSREKDILVIKLRLLEEERVRLVNREFDEDLSLHQVCELTASNELLDLRSRLISLIQSIEELNEFNRVLIDRSLLYLRNTSRFFRKFGLDRNKGVAGALLSREI